jgi:hypothetical protein
MLPFTPEQFLAVFTEYNVAIWPSQIVAYLLGGMAVLLLFWQTAGSSRVIAAVLTAMWIWTGVFYHGIWFSQINKSAYLFATLFIIEGCGLFFAAAYGSQLRFGFRRDTATCVGATFVGYAAIVYPLIGMATGHRYPAVPMFGVTPCPVTIFTFGMLLLTIGPVPRWLLIIPVIWSLIGGSAAILLAVPQDWLLLLSGFVAVPLIFVRDNRHPKLGVWTA